MSSGLSRKPAIPTQRPEGIGDDLWRYLQSIKEIIESYEGSRGSVYDQILTKQDAVNAGIELRSFQKPSGLRVNQAQIGNRYDYSNFTDRGLLQFKGDAQVWKDDNISAVSLGIGASPPDLVQYNGTNIYVRAFSGNVTLEELFGGTEYNHDGEEGADIHMHLHWSPTTNNAGDVKWQLGYVWINNNGVATAETTVSVISSATGTAWDQIRASFPTIAGAGKKIGSQLGFRLFRDPNDAEDTYPDDAAITFTFGMHYELDQVGSNTIGTK
jgi:hypothetical protein